MDYRKLSHDETTPVGLNLKSAILQLEGTGCLNGAFALEHATKKKPARGAYALFWHHNPATDGEDGL